MRCKTSICHNVEQLRQFRTPKKETIFWVEKRKGGVDFYWSKEKWFSTGNQQPDEYAPTKKETTIK